MNTFVNNSNRIGICKWVYVNKIRQCLQGAYNSYFYSTKQDTYGKITGPIGGLGYLNGIKVRVYPRKNIEKKALVQS